MGKTGKTKFRSIRRKKRKGFCATKGPNKRLKLSCVDKIQDGIVEENQSSGGKDVELKANVSASKLLNSSF